MSGDGGVSVTLTINGVADHCTAERDGPFWRVTSGSRPEVSAAAVTLAKAQKDLERRLVALAL